MLFMVIETFPTDGVLPLYRKLRREGRTLPEGVEFVESYIEVGFSRAFQVMRADSAAALQAWVLTWQGLGIEFEIVPVMPSKDVQGLIAPILDREEAEG